MVKYYETYKEMEAKEIALKKQIDELESKKRAIKTTKAQVADLLSKMGSISNGLSFYEYQHKRQAVYNAVRNGELTREQGKEEKDKLEQEYAKIKFLPTIRRWLCREAKMYGSDAKRYYLHIDNRACETHLERYDTTEKSYNMIIQERPELKRYKWEIEINYPDPSKYRETITETTKYKDLQAMAADLINKLKAVETIYKEHNKELFEITPETFDLETIITETPLPFEVTDKNIIVKE
jgi:hypothetical protein